ncbi:hypothetical protein [Thiosulfatihalobacter marinus]|jgi:hypothetical protein|uniref:hypothetical protein n=1 Tax=Thiosulfatihalobacter marinus TaxID=2792481 RepID=UPI0018D5D6F0|nr:hypothetical protein [Thiosulfatihalobacter marinus]
MSTSQNAAPENVAERALELLEQAYAYYTPPLKAVARGQAAPASETYYEYVKAA